MAEFLPVKVSSRTESANGRGVPKPQRMAGRCSAAMDETFTAQQAEASAQPCHLVLPRAGEQERTGAFFWCSKFSS